MRRPAGWVLGEHTESGSGLDSYQDSNPGPDTSLLYDTGKSVSSFSK